MLYILRKMHTLNIFPLKRDARVVNSTETNTVVILARSFQIAQNFVCLRSTTLTAQTR